MPKKIYNKLVRDRIPEIIAASGREFEVDAVGYNDFSVLLREKLVEEALEVRDSDDDLLTELADIEEVIDGLLQLHGFDREDLSVRQQKRRELRGGFELRLRLLWTE